MPDLITPETLVAFAALVLTSAGATVAAGVVTKIIDALKRVAPGLFPEGAGREKLYAFVVATVLVLAALAVGLLEVPPRYVVTSPLTVLALVVGAVLAIYNIGRLSMGVHDDLARKPGSLGEPSVEAVATRDAEIATSFPSAPPPLRGDQPPGDVP
jgi:hypothetical protein